MTVSLARAVSHYNLHTAERGIVGPLAFLAVGVANIVGILFLKLQTVIIMSEHSWLCVIILSARVTIFRPEWKKRGCKKVHRGRYLCYNKAMR